MLAAFGMPGHLELIILGLLCLFTIGVPVLVVVVLQLTKGKRATRQSAIPCPHCGMLAEPTNCCPHCGNPMNVA